MAGNNVLSPTDFTTLLVADTVAISGGSNDSPQKLSKIAGGVPVSNVTVQTACYAASTANLNATYANGASGVGATLTNAGVQAAFTIDSVSPPLASRILVKDQTNAAQNGIYTVTTVGSGASNWVLTRATDYDSAAEIVVGSYALINLGTVNAGLSFVEVSTVATIGTDNIDFRPYLGHLPAAVGISLQSTKGCFYIEGVTTAQRDAFDSSFNLIADGMIAYNKTTGLFNFRQNGAWDVIGANAISGPAASTDNAVARWDGAGGNTLQDSVVVIGDTGAITGALTIANGAGAIGAPSYTFTGNLTAGLWSSAANVLDFSTNSLRSLQIASAPAVSVNYLVISPQVTNGADAALQPFITAGGFDSNADVAVKGKGTAGFAILPSSTAVAANLKLWNGAGTFYTSLNAGVNAANLNLTLPIADGLASTQTALSSNGAGVLTFSPLLVQYASGTLSSGDILGMNFAAVAALAAPGAGLMHVVHRLEMTLIYNSAQYGNGGVIYLQYGAGAANTNYATLSTGVAATFLTGPTANQVVSIEGQQGAATGGGILASAVSNVGLFFTNATAPFITGNSTVAWKVWYSTVSVT